MAKIFISYRRRDSAYVAEILCEKIQQRFGEDSVFYDIDNIPLGVDFRDHIGDAVGQCGVLIVIIGEEWLDAADKQGNRRLEDAGDYVRIEIESALKRNIPLIPLLIDEVVMPIATDLPETIQTMVFRNAAELRAGRDFRQHMDLLLRGLEKHFQKEEKAKSEEPKKEPIQEPKTDDKKPAPKEKGKPAPKQKKRALAPKSEPAKTEQRTYSKEDNALYLIYKILDGFTDSSIFLRGEIPEYKLKNAISTYAGSVAPKDVLLLYDNTVFGGAKDGLIITPNMVLWHNISEGAGNIPFSDIQTVTFDEGIFTNDILINGRAVKVNVAADRAKVTKTLADLILNLAQSVDKDTLGSDPAAHIIITSDDGACQLSLPFGWGRQANLNSDAKLQAGKPSEELYVIIIPEPKSYFSDATTIDTYVGIIRTNLLKTLAEPQFTEPVSVIVGGLLARQFEVSGVISGLKITYLYGIVESHKTFYQITTWTLTEKFKNNRDALLEVINGFKEIS